MASLNYSRLDLARKRRGLTKTALADRAGVSTRILTAYERGDKEPTSATLSRLADALEFPVAFFSRDEVDEPSLEASSFRALSTLTARQRDQALSSAAIALDLAAWIDERFNLPVSNLPELAGIDPETAATAVRQEWGLGERPVKNMVHLLEAHGVRVFSLAEECREVDAFSFWQGSTPFIFLNTMKTPERSRMDCAHELGHLVLHYHGGPRGRKAEQEAQAFGSAFLMPRGSVLADAPRRGSLSQIHSTKHRWKVSAANLVYRMHAVGLLTEWQYRSLFIQMGQSGDRETEKAGMQRRETSQVLEKVFRALREEGQSKASIARQLGIPLAELNKLVFGLTLTPVAGAGREEAHDHARPKLYAVESPEDQ